MQGLYLALNLGTIALPLGYSLTRRSGFRPRFLSAWLSITLVALPFLIWDYSFTQRGIWGFNSTYLIGISLGELPIEEILFFFCIPFACLFLHDQIHEKLKEKNYGPFPEKIVRLLAALLSFVLITLALLNNDKAYTFSAFALAGICLAAWATGALRIRTVSFSLSFLVVLLPFFLVNGVLTGMPVVWYDNTQNLGIRLGSIPLEDSAYCLALLFSSIWIFSRQIDKRNPNLGYQGRNLSENKMTHSSVISPLNPSDSSPPSKNSAWNS
jgi:lycopene cyclase domain-containing protein